MKSKKSRTISESPMLWIFLSACVGIYASGFISAGIISYTLVVIACAIAYIIHRHIGIYFIIIGTFLIYSQTFDPGHQPGNIISLIKDKGETLDLICEVDSDVKTKSSSGKYPRQQFYAKALKVMGKKGWCKISGIIHVKSYVPSAEKPEYGDIIRIKGYTRTTERRSLPGGFDEFEYYKNRGAYSICTTYSKNITILKRKPSFYKLLLSKRNQVRKILAYGVENDPEASHLMEGILFGFHENLEPEIIDQFKRSGTLHLFAVSGQNIASIALIGIILLRCLSLNYWKYAFILIPPLYIFYVFSGMEASAFRAFTMLSILIAGWLLLRPVNILNICGTAGFITLLINPHDLFNTSFQLSFAIVIALILFSPGILTRTNQLFFDQYSTRSSIKLSMKSSSYLIGILIVSLIAWLSSQPILSCKFQTITPITPVSNIFAVPISTLILFATILSILLGSVSIELSLIPNIINKYLCYSLLSLVALFSGTPISHFNLSVNNFYQSCPHIYIYKDYDKIYYYLQNGFDVQLFTNSPKNKKTIDTLNNALGYNHPTLKAIKGTEVFQTQATEYSFSDDYFRISHLPTLPTLPTTPKPLVVSIEESEEARNKATLQTFVMDRTLYCIVVSENEKPVLRKFQDSQWVSADDDVFSSKHSQPD